MAPKKFRKVISDADMVKQLQKNILNISTLSIGALPVINDALWDVNPIIHFDENKKPLLSPKSLLRLFEIISEYATSVKNK